MTPDPSYQGRAQFVMKVCKDFVDALHRDGVESGYDLESGLFGPHVSNLLREFARLRYEANRE